MQEAELPIWAQLAVGLEQAWEQLRINMLKREGIDPDAANQAVSTPDRKSPAPPAPEQAPGSQGQAQPRTGRSQTDLAPLHEAPRQDSSPGKRTALDVIDAAIAELAEERFSGYRPENPPAADRDGRSRDQPRSPGPAPRRDHDSGLGGSPGPVDQVQAGAAARARTEDLPGAGVRRLKSALKYRRKTPECGRGFACPTAGTRRCRAGNRMTIPR